MSTNSENKLIKTKDINTIKEFDYEKLELLRGETPEDIQKKCLQLCKDYLSANWRQQSVNTIEFKRISGGLTNQLYYCAIAEPSAHPQDVPQEVVIRLYGKKTVNTSDNEENDRLTDVVIGLMVSSNKLGPKIYGVFESGQIHKYYQHRLFTYADQSDPILVREVFQKLARLHAMDVPINKNFNWLFNEFDRAYKLSFGNEIRKKQLDALFKDRNCDLFERHDLSVEIEWVKKLVLKTNSPIVLTHNDFRSRELMVLENNHNLTETSDRILLIDYEYTCYGFRGIDFQHLVQEWGKSAQNIGFVPLQVSVFKPLIEIYVSESERIFGKTYSENPINSVDNILKEIKIFSLVKLLFGILFFLKNDEKTGLPVNDKFVADLCDHSYKDYLNLKDQYKKENLVE